MTKLSQRKVAKILRMWRLGWSKGFISKSVGCTPTTTRRYIRKSLEPSQLGDDSYE